MITDTEKVEIIKWVAGLKDKEVIRQLKKMKERSCPEPKDWWETLSYNEKHSVEKGIDEAKKKKMIQQSEIRRSYERWL